MDEIAVGSVYLAGYLAPFCAFLWATRRPGATAASVIWTSTFAGLAGGICFVLISVVLAGPSLLRGAGLYPWVVVLTGWGAFVGTAGIAARLLGHWWSRRL